MSKVFNISIGFKDDLELIESVLTAYSAGMKLTKKNKLSSRHFRLMAYYICLGYSKETAEKYREESKKTEVYLNVLNSELKAVGYLIDINGNKRKRDISPAMQRLKDHYLREMKDGDYSILSFAFVKRS